MQQKPSVWHWKSKRLLTEPNSLAENSQSIFILAGEESADNHGAKLMQAILDKREDIKFIGIGGEKMIQNGLFSLEPINHLAVMGFVEVLKHLPFFQRLIKKIMTEIEKESPCHIILIDYPGFNLRLAKKIKENFDIPITYYISPQLWAWKENRVKTIRKYIDQMLVIFPFEENWYHERGVKASFTGHPIIDEFVPTKKGELCRELNLDSTQPIITLYPGSRQQEVNQHLPIMIQASQKLSQYYNNLQFVLGAATQINLNKWNLPNWVKVETQQPQLALEAADLAIVASGTSTVEAAVFGTPMIIVYKMAALSWWLSTKLVKVPFAGMVNIIAGNEIMPELLQDNFTVDQVFEKAQEILSNPDMMNEMQSELKKVRNALKGSGASQNAAEKILEYIS